MGRKEELLAIKNYNEQLILKEIYLYGPVSRISLSKKLDLSPTAVSDLTKDLLNKELIIDNTKLKIYNNGAGRPARGLVFNIKAGYVFIIKEEINKLEGAILDLGGNIVYTVESLYKIEEGSEKFLERIGELIDRLFRKLGDKELWGIGVVIRGVVIENKVYMHSQIKGWGEVDIYNYILKQYNFKPYIINYPNSAAIGEIKNDNDRKITNLLYINWGMSIGMGIIINRKLYKGSRDIAGEIGHIIVDDRSEVRCYCGKYGCLEAVATGRSLIKDIQSALEEGVSSSLQKIDKNINIELIIEEALNGDKLAYSKLKEKFRFLGKGLAILSDIFDPDTIIIGGEMIKAGEEFFNILRMEYSEEMLSIPIIGYKEQSKINLKLTDINEKNVFLGGVAIITDTILSM